MKNIIRVSSKRGFVRRPRGIFIVVARRRSNAAGFPRPLFIIGPRGRLVRIWPFKPAPGQSRFPVAPARFGVAAFCVFS